MKCLICEGEGFVEINNSTGVCGRCAGSGYVDTPLPLARGQHLMTRWAFHSDGGEEGLARHLDEMSTFGWELITATPMQDSDSVRLFFRKPA